MKRIQSACLLQTVHFQLKDDLPRQEAVNLVESEYARYRSAMDRSRVRYQILREERQPDGSILIEIKKQYNQYSCGGYLEG